MNTLIVSPLLIPLATLVATLLARRSPRVVTALSLAGALALTAAGLVLVALAAQGQILATQAGDWAAPYGITLVVDRLSAAMVAITGVVGTATIVFALAVLKRSWELHGNVETDRITAVAEEPAPDLPAPGGHA